MKACALPPLVIPRDVPRSFNGMTLSPARFERLKAALAPFPSTYAGQVGDITLYTDPMVPDDIAVLMCGDEVVGVINLGPGV